MDIQKLKENKSLKIIILVLVFIIVSIIGAFGTYNYFDKLAQKQAVSINSVLSNSSFSTCEIILFGDIEAYESNKYINPDDLTFFKKTCEEKYSLENVVLNEANCEEFISGNSSEDLKEDYLFLEGYEGIKTKCNNDFQKIVFSTGSFFDIENDFKSSIGLEFIVPFFTDLDDANSEEFIENRIKAKQRLIDLIEISPNVELSIDDLVLYPGSAVLNLSLEPTTDYSIKLKEAKIRGKSHSEEVKTTYSGEVNIKYNVTYDEPESFDFKTPENKYLGIKILNPVSLYMDTRLPKFQVLDYDSGKQSVGIKICKIDEEIYSKIDLLKGRALTSENKDFFINSIDKLNTISCEKKEIVLRGGDSESSSEGQKAEGQYKKFIKKDFDFEKEIGQIARNGLYYVTFDNYIDREFNSRVQKPILFGVIDSHITMKISRNGEAFFFVNDFEGNPLEGQNIKIYLNDFNGKDKSWNREKRDYDETFYSPLDEDVLSKEILIGRTGTDGSVKINLKDTVPEAFYRTFDDSWDFDWTGVYNSFFVKSEGKKHLSYNHSKWNAGIAPWNFGYKIGGYWGNAEGSDITLNIWGQTEPEYYTHTYTDRILYLPSEEINFKTIVRKSNDLSIETNKIFGVIIKDSNGKEIYSKNLQVSEFGSIYDSLVLTKDAPLGYYSIVIKDNGKQIGYSTFSVEVFKNPKFKTEISLQAFGLESGIVKIDEVEKINYRRDDYKGKFSIKANLSSKYYNGASLTNASYTYKVYKQAYYDNAWWGDCFYGCYWEPGKEFYTSGEGELNVAGVASLNIDVDFKSSYDDYKYIVEVTIKDSSGDKISSSNSLIVKLPDEYKRWNNNLSLNLNTTNKFYKAGDEFKITGELTGGKWTKYFDDKYILIVKKKDYITKKVEDVRGYTRSVNKVEESLEDIIFINSTNFKVSNDGKLELNYSFKESGEYIFEYGKINDTLELGDSESIEDIVKEFRETKNLSVNIDRKYRTKKYERVGKEIIDPCVGKENCSFEIENTGNANKYNTGRFFQILEIKNEDLSIDSLLDYSSKYFSLLSYSESDANNPIISDNKLHVFSEKFVYKAGEKARVLVRLPFSKGKILWTVEKAGVVHSEYIDVESNMFFKEFVVDDSFIPNAYIGVTAIPSVIVGLDPTIQGIDPRVKHEDDNFIPEYKVGYTEIIVDKTDKKSFVTVKSDKKVYAPREEVILDLEVKNKEGKAQKSELSVMVIDDSLISLMGNVDLNVLEKFYKKLPFQIQTSLTNLSMLKNYYFARPGIVGGSGFGDFKGGDSAVSTRNIFKNTAFYDASVITDENGKARVKFNLPDNLTNFRIIVVANSKDNFFGVSEEFIEVRQNVIVEPKTPIILRDGDELQIGANIFNNTDKTIGFKVKLEAVLLEVEQAEKNIEIQANASKFVYFGIKNRNIGGVVNYTISALGDSPENSDKYEGTIEIKQSPVLIQTTIKHGVIPEAGVLDLELEIPENTDLEKSKVEVIFSNNKLVGIEKIVNSLVKYPYGCIEQTVSSTLPNAILKRFSNIFKDIDIDRTKIDKNIEDGVARIKSMQMSDGGFSYWQGGSSSKPSISPYVVRSLLDMKEMGVYIEDSMLEKSISYLENISDKLLDNGSKSENLWALAKYYKSDINGKYLENINTEKLSRHDYIAYTYALVLIDKVKFKETIDENIEKIKNRLDDNENYWYWNSMSDKAIFSSLLIDYNYDLSYTTELITDLYDNDWESYYYSTQSKNNSFMAFSKYIEKYGKDNKNNFGFMLGKEFNKNQFFYIGQTKVDILKKEYLLKDVLYENENSLSFRAANTSGKDMYASLILKQYPKDFEKVEEFSAGIKVSREIYEVSDSSKLDACEKAQNSYYNRGKDLSSLSECKGIYSLHSSKDFGKGKTYKAKIVITFPSEKLRRNVVLEDYLPSSFRVLNNKFKTESISTSQNTTTGRRWDHVEFKPEVVFANSSRSYGDTLIFEYFFIPEFEGTFTYPPVTAYIMYNPQVRANSKYQKIVVK